MTHLLEYQETRLGVFEARWTTNELQSLRLLEPQEAISSEAVVGRSTLLGKLSAHLAGEPQDFSEVPLDFAGLSEFAISVYRASQTVPAGHTISYLDLARKLRNPGAVRAVGGALGRNPFLVVVPCHRILAAGGKLGGFSAPGASATKELLLATEGWGTESLFDQGEMARGEQHLKHCPKLAPILEQIGPCPLQPLHSETPFCALARSILYQQLAGSAAEAIEKRVKKLGHPPFPTAEEFAFLDQERLREAGVSRPKIMTLKALAEATLEGRLVPDRLHLLPNGHVESEISKIKGLGPWTAAMFLLFHLGRRDVFPVNDLGIRKAMQKLYGLRQLPNPETMKKLAKTWRPYRSLASWYLWRSLEIN